MVHPTVKQSQEQEALPRDRYSDWKQSDLSRVGMHLHDTVQDIEDESSVGQDDFKDWNCSPGFQGFNQERRESKGSESEASRISKDEKLARDAGVRFSIDQIVGLPMDEFNDLLSKQDLTEEQLNLCRDIRRRGKNKVAAQNCRKRKIDQVEELSLSLRESREHGKRLSQEQAQKTSEYNKVASDVNAMMNKILISQGHNPNTHTIVKGANGELKIIKKTSPNSEPEGSLRPVPIEKIEDQPSCSINGLQFHNSHNFYQ